MRILLPACTLAILLHALPSRAQEPVSPPPPVVVAPSGNNAGGPVVLPEPGNWGMSFTFGGLAPFSAKGINDFDNFKLTNLLFSEIGMRVVLKQVVIPFSFGLGVASLIPKQGGSGTDFGFSASVGVFHWFRVWRRISPFVGGLVHLHYLDPDGPDNWLVNFSLGPMLGIEYFIADRVSLSMTGLLLLGVDGIGVAPGTSETLVSFGTSIAAGGQMGLTFYF